MTEYKFFDGVSLLARGLWVLVVCLIRFVTIGVFDLVSLAWKCRGKVLLGVSSVVGSACFVALIMAGSWLIA